MSQQPVSLEAINSASVAVVVIICLAVSLISIVAHESKTQPAWAERFFNRSSGWSCSPAVWRGPNALPHLSAPIVVVGSNDHGIDGRSDHNRPSISCQYRFGRPSVT